MKIFRVESNDTDFDEYYSIVVVADSAARALEIAKEGNPWRSGLPLQEYKDDRYWYFSKEQYPLTVTEIDLNKEYVVESSNRGS